MYNKTTERAARDFRTGDIVEHFKGNKYLIVAVSTHTESKEKMITYRSIYGGFEYWTRPYEMFMSEVDHEKYPNVAQKYRFELVNRQG